MSDFNPATMFAITHEMFGVWLWILLALGAVVVLLHVAGWLSGRRLTGGMVRLSAFAGLAVAVVAGLLLPSMTQSSLTLLNGAADVLGLMAFALAIGIGLAITLSGIARWTG